MSQPLVSVVTPVYNEADYLAECIESVLAQTYSNWDYTIVDNCSTDRSLEIARDYAGRDPRIRVIANNKFVGAIENHNIAFRSISAPSVYCKLLSGDDWLYPEFLERSIEVGEQYPNVGVIASYSINNAFGFRWPKLNIGQTVFDGHEVGRLFLLGLIDSFFAPSILIYRSSLVRAQPAFFPGTARSADLSACLECLTKSDLGFVHQVLSFERIHEDSDTAKAQEMLSYLLDRIDILKEHGPRFLKANECTERVNVLLTAYYEDVLVPAVFAGRNREYWDLQRARLKEMGYSIWDRRFAKGMAKKVADLVLNPKQTLEKITRPTKRVEVRGDEVHPSSDLTCKEKHTE